MNARNEEEDYLISDVVSKLLYISDIYSITDDGASINRINRCLSSVDR